MRLAMFESKNRGVWFAWWLDGKDVNGGIGNEVEGMKFKGGVVLTEMKALMPLMALIPWRSSRTIETNLAEKKGWGKEWLELIILSLHWSETEIQYIRLGETVKANTVAHFTISEMETDSVTTLWSLLSLHKYPSVNSSFHWYACRFGYVLLYMQCRLFHYCISLFNLCSQCC